MQAERSTRRQKDKAIAIPSGTGASDNRMEDVETLDNAEDQCSICLQIVIDRTIIPACSHEFCYECLLVWTEQSRRCPLCSQTVGEYVIHHIRSQHDYQKYHLPPLRTSPKPARVRITHQARREERDRSRWYSREREAADDLERAIAKRRWIYRHDLYAKHVASNSFTKYRPYPTPAQFSASTEFVSRITSFVRRELQVWASLDVEFLTTFVVSLMRSIDIRSESAVKLLSEFLDMDEPYIEGQRHVNAEHFAHEVYSYLRSPYRDLAIYDSIVQYDDPPGEPELPNIHRSSRWENFPTDGSRSPSNAEGDHPSWGSPTGRLQNDSPQRSECSGSISWSPSGRRRSPSINGLNDVRPRKRRFRRSRSRNQIREESGYDKSQKRRREGDVLDTTISGSGSSRREPESSTSFHHNSTRSGSRGEQKAIGMGPLCDHSTRLNADSSGSIVLTPPEAEPVREFAHSSANSLDRSHPNREGKPLHRRLNLSESVQAHLKQSGARVREPSRFQNVEPAEPSCHVHLELLSTEASPTTYVPPLPARMPDPDRGDTSDGDHPNINSACNSLEPPPPHEVPRLTAPKIMARTRARLAHLKYDVVDPCTSSQINGTAKATSTYASDLSGSGSATGDQPLVRDTRQSLLTKLESEKKHAVILSRAVRGQLGEPLGIGTVSKENAVTDASTSSIKTEANLRTRVRLQARLAKEREVASRTEGES